MFGDTRYGSELDRIVAFTASGFFSFLFTLLIFCRGELHVRAASTSYPFTRRSRNTLSAFDAARSSFWECEACMGLLRSRCLYFFSLGVVQRSVFFAQFLVHAFSSSSRFPPFVSSSVSYIS